MLTAFHPLFDCPTCIHRIFPYHVSFFFNLYNNFLSSFVNILYPQNLYPCNLLSHPHSSLLFSPLFFPVRTPMPTQSPRPPTWLASGTCCSSPLRTSALSLMSCSRSGLTTGGLWTRPRGRYEHVWTDGQLTLFDELYTSAVFL